MKQKNECTESQLTNFCLSLNFIHFFTSADKDMYHALGYAIILYMQAAMTFESVSKLLKHSLVPNLLGHTLD